MIDDDFVSPPPASEGDRFKPADHSGRLLLITPKEVKYGFKEGVMEKPDDVVRADVVALDGGDIAPEVFVDTLFFGALSAALRRTMEQKPGKKALGRLGQGTKKPGKNAPWILADATDSDRSAARRYLATLDEPPF